MTSKKSSLTRDDYSKSISDRQLEKMDDRQLVTTRNMLLYGLTNGKADSAGLMQTDYDRVCNRIAERFERCVTFGRVPGERAEYAGASEAWNVRSYSELEELSDQELLSLASNMSYDLEADKYPALDMSMRQCFGAVVSVILHRLDAYIDYGLVPGGDQFKYDFNNVPSDDELKGRYEAQLIGLVKEVDRLRLELVNLETQKEKLTCMLNGIDPESELPFYYPDDPEPELPEPSPEDAATADPGHLLIY